MGLPSYICTHYVKTPFTGNHSDGTIEVSTTDAPKLWPGARGIIGSSTQPEVEVLILEDLGTGHFRVRRDDSAVGNVAFGNPTTAATDKAGSPRANPTPKAGSNWSAYTVADGAYILQFQDQMIFSYTRDGVVPRTPSAAQGT
jgi:hypothetical protein